MTGIDFATTVQDLEDVVGDVPLVCEIRYRCASCGEWDVCGEEATWSATMICKQHPRRPCEHHVLVCDSCHDDLVANGDETPFAKVQNWQPL